jgi:16S rRNA (guanine(966)-N(2))-methyltransferase RsmD
LGDRFAGRAFLDLYAGSGAVGIEAWSRGAARVCWVESSGRVLRELQANVRALCEAADCHIVRGDVERVLRRDVPAAPFAVIFADPPYARDVRDARARERLFELIAESGLLAPGGWFVLEQGEHEGEPAAAGWLRVTERRYGGTTLRAYERASNDEDR